MNLHHLIIPEHALVILVQPNEPLNQRGVIEQLNGLVKGKNKPIISSVIGRQGLLKLEERLLSEEGIEVYLPSVDYKGVDLVTRYERGEKAVYKSVQVKYSSGRNGRYLFGVMKSSFRPNKDLLMAFVCGTSDQVLLIPSMEFEKMLEHASMNAKGKQYKIAIELRKNIFYLHQKGKEKIQLNEYLDLKALKEWQSHLA